MTEDVVVCNGDTIIVFGPSVRRRFRVWRRHRERYSDAAVIQRDRWDGQGVMIWGGISARFRTELIVVPGNLTEIRYHDENSGSSCCSICSQSQPCVSAGPREQDNARAHTARVATTFLQHNVDTLTLACFLTRHVAN